MVMLVDISSNKLEFNAFVSDMKKLGEEIGVDIYAQHEDIFNSMHKI
jgi:ACT domain-containing protein